MLMASSVAVNLAILIDTSHEVDIRDDCRLSSRVYLLKAAWDVSRRRK